MSTQQHSIATGPATGADAADAGAGTAVPAAPAPALHTAHVFAAPAAAPTTSQGGIAGVGQITLALCIVLAAIFAFAWIARRLRGLGAGGRALDIIADIRLGPKERAVVLQVGSQQLLLGVAPGRVSTLHVLPEPLPPAQPNAVLPARLPNFADILRRSLGK